MWKERKNKKRPSLAHFFKKNCTVHFDMSAKNMRLFFVETLNCDNKVVFDKLNVRNELSNWPFQNETNTIIRSARQSEFMLELASPFSTFHLIRKQGKLWTVLCVPIKMNLFCNFALSTTKEQNISGGRSTPVKGGES